MWLLEIFLELGLLVADERHYKKVRKKEKADGSSRPIQKYVLSPSVKIYVSVFVIVIFLIGSWFLYTVLFAYPKQTLKEMKTITHAIVSYEENTGKKIQSLETLVVGRPLRKDWLKDAWGKPYQLTTIPNFQLISAGSDSQFGTEDDIRISH
ncbi:type II secretion system protein GspG [uncultured Dokdonia sp.]|uniref:type II secretion system protein GspG n=1 Tax=uncultured Dokdonia sp. TaxID=575653 RepID=UPI002620A81B|nr:type II secretion system protein GspG [uncultured Dokdonia sp.]